MMDNPGQAFGARAGDEAFHLALYDERQNVLFP